MNLQLANISLRTVAKKVTLCDGDGAETEHTIIVKQLQVQKHWLDLSTGEESASDWEPVPEVLEADVEEEDLDSEEQAAIDRIEGEIDSSKQE